MGKKVASKVNRLYVHEDCCYIRLENPKFSPKDGYFKLNMTHPNYSALYSLALAAALNRYDLSIRTRAEITNTEHAEIVYFVLDF